MPHDVYVFDCHQHMGTTADAMGVAFEGALSSIAELDALELDRRLEFMDMAGIAQAMAIPGHNYDRSQGVAATRAQNDAIARYRDETPARFPAAAGLIEPLDQQAALDELGRVADELRLSAISFHTEYQGVTLDSPWMYKILDKMGNLGIVPLLHAANIIPHEALWRLAKVARAFPDLEIVALEPFFTYEGIQEALFVAEIAPNILFDLAACVDSDFAIDFVREVGSGRVLYGSQFYSQAVPRGKRLRSHDRHAIGMIDDLITSDLLTDADKAAILGGNARRIFGLSAQPLDDGKV